MKRLNIRIGLWSAAGKLERLLVLATAIFIMVTLSACIPDGSGGPTPPSPPPGFTIQTVFRSGTVLVVNPGVRGSACRSDTVGIFPVADVANCTPSNHGAQLFFWRPTAGDGTLFIFNNTFPVSYEFIQDASHNCNVPATTDITVNNQGQLIPLICASFLYTSIDPSSIVADSEPSAITISGSGINNLYGMPEVRVYNEFGYVVA